jgi:hypothetical protein
MDEMGDKIKSAAVSSLEEGVGLLWSVYIPLGRRSESSEFVMSEMVERSRV